MYNAHRSALIRMSSPQVFTPSSVEHLPQLVAPCITFDSQKSPLSDKEKHMLINRNEEVLPTSSLEGEISLIIRYTMRRKPMSFDWNSFVVAKKTSVASF